MNSSSTKVSKNIRVIRPDDRENESVFIALYAILGQIKHFRSHISIVFKEEFRSSYSGTKLGVFWNIILPIVPLTVYWALAALRVFPSFEDIDGATYVAFGVTIWFFFSGCVQVPIQVVLSRNNETMKTEFPLSASIVSGFAKLLFDTLIRLVVVLIIVVFGQSWPAWTIIFLPFVCIPAFMFFVGIGVFLSILNVVYNDISRVVNIVLQYGIFISGVLFPVIEVSALSIFNAINPFAIYIQSVRSITFHGFIDNLYAYIALSMISLAIFLFSVRLFHIMEYRIRGVS